MNPVTFVRLQKGLHFCDSLMLAVGMLMILYVGIARSKPRLRKLLAQFGSRRMIDAVDELERTKPDLPTFTLAKV